jgi:hypothetical protein
MLPILCKFNYGGTVESVGAYKKVAAIEFEPMTK